MAHRTRKFGSRGKLLGALKRSLVNSGEAIQDRHQLKAIDERIKQLQKDYRGGSLAFEFAQQLRADALDEFKRLREAEARAEKAGNKRDMRKCRKAADAIIKDDNWFHAQTVNVLFEKSHQNVRMIPFLSFLPFGPSRTTSAQSVERIASFSLQEKEIGHGAV